MPITKTERRVVWTDPHHPGETYADSLSAGTMRWLLHERPNTENVRVQARTVTYGDWADEEPSLAKALIEDLMARAKRVDGDPVDG